MNWLLLLTILFCAANIVWGYRQGFFRVLYSLVGWILVIVIITWSSPYISDYLYQHTSIPTKIEQACSEKIQQAITEEIEERTEDANSIDGGDKDILQKVGIMLPAVLLEKVFLESGTSQELAEQVSTLVVKGISYVIALILALLVCALLKKIINLINKIPILGGINRYMGILAGAVRALVIVWIVFAITATFAGTDWGRFIISYIYENPILIWIYEHNLVLDTFATFF